MFKKTLKIILHIIQWIAFVFYVIISLAAFFSGSVLAGIFCLTAGFVISPLVEKTSASNIPKLLLIQIIVSFMLFTAGAMFYPDKTDNKTSGPISVAETTETSTVITKQTTVTTEAAEQTSITTTATETTTVTAEQATTTTEVTTIPETTVTQPPTTTAEVTIESAPPAPATESPQAAEIKNSSEYWVNTDSGKFHRPNCRTIKNPDEPHWNVVDTTKSELIEQGYSACKVCNP